MVTEKELARVCTGMRIINNTKWPIEHTLKRVQADDRKYWLITYGICNGTAAGSKRFSTYKAAVQSFQKIL